LAPPFQAQIGCWVPLVVLLPGSSRHFAEPVPTREESGPAVHCWLVPPLQVQSWTSVPLAVALPVTSRHLPLICAEVPSVVQFWAEVPSQSVMTTGVPLAEPLAARHLPA